MIEVEKRGALADSVGVDHSNALPGNAGIKLAEHPNTGHIVLRGEKAIAVAKGHDILLPEIPNRIEQNDNCSAIWRGPDEWLLLCHAIDTEDLSQKFESAFVAGDGAAVDISSGQTLLSVSGKNCRDVVAKGCTLDLHTRSFAIGACAQTLLSQASVTLWPDTPNSFRLIVRRSFANYLWEWLIDASKEYGCAIVIPEQ